MSEFTGLRPKMYSYIKDNDKKDKKTKGTKKKQKMYYKREINFNDYKSCLNPSKTEKKINILNVNN